MEIALGTDATVVIDGYGSAVTMKVKRPEGEHTYKIEKQIPYELVDDQWVELTGYMEEEEETILKQSVTHLVNKIHELGDLRQMLFFDAILTDLIEGKPLDWLPQGHFYLDLLDRPDLLVFNSKEDRLKHGLQWVALEDDSIDLDAYPGWDPINEEFEEIPHREYYFTTEEDVRDYLKSQY